MPRGPLPDPNAQRRNASTIPTTDLPAEGFQGEIPDVPSWVELGDAGRAYWEWAWRTPEAAAWGSMSGAVDAVAKRASMEDDLAAIEVVSHFNIGEILESNDDLEALEAKLKSVLGVLSRLAGGKTTVVKDMGRLDIELGLTPKARQALRWTIKGATEPAKVPNAAGEAPTEGSSAKTRLRVVNGGGG